MATIPCSCGNWFSTQGKPGTKVQCPTCQKEQTVPPEATKRRSKQVKKTAALPGWIDGARRVEESPPPPPESGQPAPSNSLLVVLVGTVVLIALAVGYLAYTQFAVPQQGDNTQVSATPTKTGPDSSTGSKTKADPKQDPPPGTTTTDPKSKAELLPPPRLVLKALPFPKSKDDPLPKGTKKLPLPDAKSLVDEVTRLRKTYQADYAKTDAADKLALADKLFIQAGKTSHPARRAVLLLEAQDLAVQAGEPAKAWQAIQELDRRFIFPDMKGMKAATLEKLTKSTVLKEETVQQIASYSQALASEYAAMEDYTAALRVLDMVESFALERHANLQATRIRKHRIEVIQQGKLPVPDDTKVEAIRKQIKELYQAEYVRTQAKERLALAQKLLRLAGETKDDPVGRYGLLKEARDLAAQAGFLDAALAAQEVMAESYAVPDLLQTKVALLKTVAKNRLPNSTTAMQAIVDHAQALAEEQTAADALESALELYLTAESYARKLRLLDDVKRIAAHKRLVAALQKEHTSAATARAAIEADPSNEQANLTMGRYLCLLKGDWFNGLAYLGKGSDARLQELASADIHEPEKPAEQVKLADGWYELSVKESDPWIKQQLLQRANLWYNRAVASLTGLTQATVKKRLDQIRAQLPRSEHSQFNRKRNVGLRALQLGAYDSASTAFKDALPLAPDDLSKTQIESYIAFSQHMKTGMNQLREKQYADASESFKQALALFPKDRAALQSLRYALLKKPKN